MDRTDIKPQRTYMSRHGFLYYVHDVIGQKVIFNLVGDVNRREMSRGRFAGLMKVLCEERMLSDAAKERGE